MKNWIIGLTYPGSGAFKEALVAWVIIRVRCWIWRAIWVGAGVNRLVVCCQFPGGASGGVVLCGVVMCCCLWREDFCGGDEFVSRTEAFCVVGSCCWMSSSCERQWVGGVAGLVLRGTSGDCWKPRSGVHGC